MYKKAAIQKGGEIAVPKKKRSGGLCLTCIHSSNCTLSSDTERPVWECEEFVDHVSHTMKVETKKVTPKTDVEQMTGPENKDSGKYLGLCCNCNHLATCTFPKPEGGIWHCEEYE